MLIPKDKSTYKKSAKLSKKEEMIIKAYKEYFPNLEKACEMSSVKLVNVLSMMEENLKFKLEMEAVRVGIFSIAEQALMSILEDKESATTHKINVAKVILQYKDTLSKF